MDGIPPRARDFSIFQIVHAGSGARAASHSMGTGVISRKSNCRGVKLTSHLRLVPRVRMSRTVGAAPIALSSVQTETTVQSPFVFFVPVYLGMKCLNTLLPN